MPFSIWAQTIELSEKNIKTSIEQVKIHLQGAEIKRSYQLKLNPGSYNLVFNGLSPKLYEETIQFKADEQLQILSISSKLNYLNRRQANQQIKTIKDSLDVVKDRIVKLDNQLESILNVLLLLDKNQELSSIKKEPQGTEDLAIVVDFHQPIKMSTSICWNPVMLK